MDQMKEILGSVAIWAAVVLGIWAVAVYTGRIVDVQIQHHEQEHAHCYSAGKMFQVSIACVPKRGAPE
jgi:hypothetical protein